MVQGPNLAMKDGSEDLHREAQSGQFAKKTGRFGEFFVGFS
jgi:hypothetical protein